MKTKLKPILGIKISHDAGIACIEGNRLLFATEFEKVGNGPRYGKMHHWRQILDALVAEQKDPNDLIPIYDGWKHGKVPDPETRYPIQVANYHEFETDHKQTALDAFINPAGVKSYFHMTGHIVGAYCTSPYSINHEPAYVISWDGGQSPRLHLVNPKDPVAPVQYIGTLHGLHGMIYSIMGLYFGPWENSRVSGSRANAAASGEQVLGWRNLPGKIMALIAKGKVLPDLRAGLMGRYMLMEKVGAFPGLKFCMSAVPEHAILRWAKTEQMNKALDPIDVLATIHEFLGELLLMRAQELVPLAANLCFVGGSALNIKWNSMLRNCGTFANVWVPPFPNDSGSAIGAACCEMVCSTGNWQLEWNVYAGPEFIENRPGPDWMGKARSPYMVGKDLGAHPNEPILCLSGRAELGPRALGHRSILMSPIGAATQSYLNGVKQREEFRPIAPMCIEARAPEVFQNGRPDPYMLFDYEVRPNWKDKIPAVVHLDGSARLQTVGRNDCALVGAILEGHEAQTGVPVLCNTSANGLGTGFFPDLKSAADWAVSVGINSIYCNGSLYVRC